MFNGKNLLELPMSKMRQIRGNHISMIFQEPTTSLNPVFSIGFQLSRVIRIHQRVSASEARRRALDMLAACEISSPERILDTYPHQLSGGMRQRAMIAMALGCGPEILIADEPTTALDVTIQAQILDLMQRLQNKFGMAMILITHDLGIVAKIAQRVVVMYAGLKVEEAGVSDLFEQPGHPYTMALMQSLPVLGKKEKFLSEIKGVVPPPYRDIPGCRFAERCPEAIEACRRKTPELKEIHKGHRVACIRR
jgi:oligopeptide/dipeptide ABC transporter ATP-binding protein